MASHSKTNHILIKGNIRVDILLQPKPESGDLDYPSESHYEPALSDEKTVERRHREQRNLKRKKTDKINVVILKTKGHK